MRETSWIQSDKLDKFAKRYTSKSLKKMYRYDLTLLFYVYYLVHIISAKDRGKNIYIWIARARGI